MKLLICVLNEADKLNDLMQAMAEHGVSDATVIESQGMGRILSHETPAFAGFRQLFAGDRPFNYTVFSVVQSDEVLERTLQGIEEYLRPVSRGGAHGLAFALPVEEFMHFQPSGH